MRPTGPGRARLRLGGERALAGLVVLGAWLALIWPIFAGRSFWHRDQILLIYPLRLYLRERLLRGEFPLWNPHLCAGRPFFGWVFPAALDPLTVLTLLPAPFGQDLFNALHLLIAAGGAFAWLRALGHDRAASTFGAVVLGYGSVLAALCASLGPYLWGNAFAPWALLLVLRLGEERGGASFVRRVVWLAACLAMMVLSGDPMAMWFAALAGAAQALASGERAGRRRALAGLALAGALGLALAAVQLLPAWELAQRYRSGGVDIDLAGRFSFRPIRLLELFVSSPWGHPFEPGWRIVRPQDGLDARPFVTSAYLGAATVPLAALGALWSGRRGRIFGALCLLALGLALGRYTPVWSVWRAVALPDRMFRYPEKHLCLFAVAITPLVSAGFARCAARVGRYTAPALGMAGLLGVAGLVTWKALPSQAALPAALMRSGLLLAAAAGIGRIAAARDWSPARVGWALLALGCVDVVGASGDVMSWAPSRVYQQPSRVVRSVRGASPRGALTRVIRPVDMDVYQERYTGEAFWDALQPNVGTQHGLTFVSPYETVVEPQLAVVLAALRDDPLKLWRMLGVSFVVDRTSATQRLPRPWIVGSMRRWGLSLVRVPSPAQRVFLASRSWAADSEYAAMNRAREAGFDPTRHAAIEGGDDGVARGRCELLEDRVETLTARCDTERGGWVVLTDTYDPAWRATVDGRPARIRRANAILRAVRVPAGGSTVRWRYEPFGVRVGAGVSVASLVACAATLVWLRRRGRGAVA